MSLTLEQRALLGTLLHTRTLTVEVHDGEVTPRWTAARQLEERGLFAWLSCSGVSVPGRKTLRVRYTLTDEGHRLLHSGLSASHRFLTPSTAQR
jgi:hypothetical protein